MKTLSLLIFCFMSMGIYSQEVPEKFIKTEANDVTVFIDGAQIISKKTVELSPGITVLKFVSLSPFVDSKSVQVKAEGEVTVLSVNHQQNFQNKLEKSKELRELESSLETIEDKINLEKTYLSIIADELEFLQENKDIGGKNEQVNIVNLQQAADFYSTKLTSLKLKEIERNKTYIELNKQKTGIQNQIKTLTSKREFPSGEILVKVDAKKSCNPLFEISYVVENAGWFPSYDIRVKNINEPVQLIYKANVKQDTKMDWNNVKLKFSSANPNKSGVAPELKTYFLDYDLLPPTYKQGQNIVAGKVMNKKSEPLFGANVIVDGTTIGTVTDSEGNYSITVPNNASQLSFSFIGHITQKLPITNSVINVMLEENNLELDEVVVMEMAVSEATQGRVAGVSVGKSNIKIRGTNSILMPTARVEKQTTVDFEVKVPYTIKSDNKNYTVDIDVYDLPASYQYYCIPKIDKNAFLMANIIDWEKYNLLEGEANIFFEETYIGKSLLDVRFASDTLAISLGRDKMVSVNREKIKEFTSKQFIGNKKEEVLTWRTTVKNNKEQKINMIILDQVPVSNLEEIEVDIQNISGATADPETGQVKWEFMLGPSDKKEFELRYSAKYPKYRNLIIE